MITFQGIRSLSGCRALEGLVRLPSEDWGRLRVAAVLLKLFGMSAIVWNDFEQEI